MPHPVPLELKENILRMTFKMAVTSKIIMDHCGLLWTTMEQYGAHHKGDVLVSAL